MKEAIIENGIIDCDIHPKTKNGLKSLIPYMSREWQKHFDNWGNFPAAPLKVPLPGRGVMLDSILPDGSNVIADPIHFKETYMDKYNVKYALMSWLEASSVVAFVNRNEASVIASACNDYALDQWCRVDSRYRLALAVSPHDPSAAAEEIERLGNEKGVAAVFLPLPNIAMGRPHFYPIYEAAQKYDLPIFIHPSGAEGAFTNGPQFVGGAPTTYFERHTRFVEVGYGNLVSLIAEGVFERFPNLKLIVCEFGYSWIPNVLWRMDQNWRNFRGTEIPWIKKAPGEYVLKHCRLTTQPFEEPSQMKYLSQIFEMIDAKNILMFSSDYPHYDYDDPETALNQLPKEMRDNEISQRIFYQNAKEFLRLL